jgi:hypothetical protein
MKTKTANQMTVRPENGKQPDRDVRAVCPRDTVPKSVRQQLIQPSVKEISILYYWMKMIMKIVKRKMKKLPV